MTGGESKIPLIALGAGPYTATLLDTFDLHAHQLPYRLAGFAQNLDASKRGETVEGLRIYTPDELRPLAATHQVICILGQGAAKQRFTDEVAAMGFRFATLIHPLSRHSPRCTAGEGFYLGLYASTFRNAKLGRHCTVLGQTIVGDENVIGDYCFFAAGVKLSGGVRVGDHAYVGAGAIVAERLTIGSHVTIGAGAVVVRDVPDGATVVGNPAREIQRRSPPA